MTFESLLVHSIYLHVLSTTTNDFGETLETYTVGTSAISCRVNPLSNSERLDNTGLFDDVRYKVYMDDAESVVRGDRITYSSEVYKVREVQTDSSTHHKTAYIALIT